MSVTTEFFGAVQAGDLARVESLLGEDSALACATNEMGVSALLWAAYHGQTLTVEHLIATGIELNLFEAAAAGHLERVAALTAESPTSVNAHSVDGFSPLGLAAFFGRADVLALLLERGADPNMASRNPLQVTPLHSAVAHRQVDVSLRMVEMLLRHGPLPTSGSRAAGLRCTRRRHTAALIWPTSCSAMEPIRPSRATTVGHPLRKRPKPVTPMWRRSFGGWATGHPCDR